MPASKAQQKAVSKYMKENYDVYQIRMPKGKKATIQAHAEAQGQSVNAYINTAIDEKIAREAAGTPTRPLEAGVVSLLSETDKHAPAAFEDRTGGINAVSSGKLEGKG